MVTFTYGKPLMLGACCTLAVLQVTGLGLLTGRGIAMLIMAGLSVLLHLLLVRRAPGTGHRQTELSARNPAGCL